MPVLKSDFLRVLTERGYVHQCTDLEALDAAAAAGAITAYIGFDATASSLHVGNLVSVMLLHRLQQTGHRPIVVMGGGTTKVGDPSGKDESRKLLTPEAIGANIASIKTAFDRFLTFGSGRTDAIMVDNALWLDQLAYIDFLREYGPHFTINRMLTFDSVKLRLEREQPLTFLEFNYMLMQAVDYLELERRHGCVLQMGGSDQWGNIVNGVELIRRIDAKAAFGLTTPLITTSSGAKMGKTAAGAVWLNADRLAPYDYWQFWRNTEDADVGKFLKLFTDVPMDEIARLEALQGAEINDAKKVLADEATALLHGREAAQSSRSAAEAAFEQGRLSQDLPTLE
ncbi:MAG TPA: tyrosine--tRNA ligase, partial [Caulobacteraceae bacterium]|nr:tyrosine--tRNA ligase [Caulobacteraceae bacterium]